MKTTKQIVEDCEFQRQVEIHQHNTEPVLTPELRQCTKRPTRRTERFMRHLWKSLLGVFMFALLLLIRHAHASTVILDQANNRIGEIPWPLDRVIVVHVFVPPLGPNIWQPRATPAPGTPAPVFRP